MEKSREKGDKVDGETNRNSNLKTRIPQFQVNPSYFQILNQPIFCHFRRCPKRTKSWVTPENEPSTTPSAPRRTIRNLRSETELHHREGGRWDGSIRSVTVKPPFIDERRTVNTPATAKILDELWRLLFSRNGTALFKKCKQLLEYQHLLCQVKVLIYI